MSERISHAVSFVTNHFADSAVYTEKVQEEMSI